MMTIVNTYISTNVPQRELRQAAIHRKCLLLLRASRTKG